MKKLFVVFAFSFLIFQPIFSQCNMNASGEFVDLNGNPCPNPILTTVPFLNFHANPQSRGMAEIGVVASPFNSSIGLLQNPALLKRNDEKEFNVNISYMPWLRNINIDDVNMTNLSTYFSWNDKNAVGLNYKNFDLGEFRFTDINGNPLGVSDAFESSVSGSYAYRLTPKFTLGLGANYFISDLGNNGIQNFRTSGLTFDFGAHYQTVNRINESLDWHSNVGLAVTNIGAKVKYTDTPGVGDYIPINLAFGVRTALEKEFSNGSSLIFSGSWQLDKLLVPTPQFENKDEDANGLEDWREYGVVKSMLVSFGDAPRGTKEEFWEIIHKIGFESWFKLNEKLRFGARTGWFLEHETKGNRRLFTYGVSASVFGFYVDYANMNQTNGDLNPLDGTYNISVGYRRVLN